MEEMDLEKKDYNEEIKKRKEKILEFLKKEGNWIYYLILTIIISVSVYIRTRPISRLKDITTGTWTLGPDLDPFLFLRWAKYIAEHGKLFLIDTMRYVPLAKFCSGDACNPINTAGEMKLLSYMIAWLSKIISIFNSESTVTYAAIIFPVIMAVLTGVAFFLFARKIFYKEDKKIANIIALIATAFFVLIPSLLPRTIAGIPEKESAAFFFMFIAFYFFLEAFTSEKLKKGLIFGTLAGISTGILGLIWGGVTFIFFTIPVAILLSFLFKKVRKKEFFIYSAWLFSSFAIMMTSSIRYNIMRLIISISTGLGIGVFLIIGGSLLIMKIKKFENIRKKINIPKELFAVIISLLILLIIIFIALGPNFVIGQISGIKSNLIAPNTNRFELTVAENKQPYFLSDWVNSFGPVLFNIPLFFWMFIAGTIMLFNYLIRKLEKKQRIILTISYFIFLISLIFSRYSPNSILNGTSPISLIIYFGGVLLFLGIFGYIYYKEYKKGRLSDFKEFEFSYILYFIILTLGIIGARGAIRLIMVLGALSPIVVSFLIIKVSQKYLKEKEDLTKLIVGLIAMIIIIASLFTLWAYYQSDKSLAESYVPGSYQQQWQKTMSWVRENTPEDSVFAHWWDYGYWVQSIGERATILDGGNAIGYWNYLMGRYVLTGTNEEEALELLYAHNGTYLLIDSTDIGKYTAFSSIGSDENYDRYSWISTFLMDETQTQETQDETIQIYYGEFVVDEDIFWMQEGQEIFLPRKQSYLGAVILRVKDEKLFQPEGIFIYNGQQYKIPLRFAYLGKQLYDFNSGLESGIFIFPKINEQEGYYTINKIGATFYLSNKTINSQLAKLYLFDKESEYFELVHSEDNLFVDSLKQQGFDTGEFVYYQGLQGPIKIWEIKYPSDIKLNEKYLETTFPNEELNTIKPGEY